MLTILKLIKINRQKSNVGRIETNQPSPISYKKTEKQTAQAGGPQGGRLAPQKETEPFSSDQEIH